MHITRHRVLLGIGVALVSWIGSAEAQRLNPQVSAIGDVRAIWSDTGEDPTLVAKEVEFELTEVELGFVGPLNPYARAEVYVGYHDGAFEIEEAKFILDRYLPFGLGLLGGRYLLNFGQLNPIHLHAYPWASRPLMHAKFFGEDGIADVGARLDWLLPFDLITLTASAAALQGSVMLGGHDHGHDDGHGHERIMGSSFSRTAQDEHDHEGEEEEEEDPTAAGIARAQAFVELTPSIVFSVGASAMAGEYDPYEGARALWATVDSKASIEFGAGARLIVNAEAMRGQLEGLGGEPDANPYGFFGSADLRLRRWNLGGWAEATTETFEDEVVTYRTGGFIGFALMEETTLFRLVGRRTEFDEGEPETAVFLQAIFALGPHAPHRY